MLRAPGAGNPRAGASKSTPKQSRGRFDGRRADHAGFVRVSVLVPVTVAAALAKLAKAHDLPLADAAGLLVAAFVCALDGEKALAAEVAARKAKGGGA